MPLIAVNVFVIERAESRVVNVQKLSFGPKFVLALLTRPPQLSDQQEQFRGGEEHLVRELVGKGGY